MEVIAQIFGMTFVSIIILCLVWTVGDYIVEDRKNKILINKRKKQ